MHCFCSGKYFRGIAYLCNVPLLADWLVTTCSRSTLCFRIVFRFSRAHQTLHWIGTRIMPADYWFIVLFFTSTTAGSLYVTVSNEYLKVVSPFMFSLFLVFRFLFLPRDGLKINSEKTKHQPVMFGREKDCVVFYQYHLSMSGKNPEILFAENVYK